MSVRFIKVEIVPTVVWDDGENLTHVDVLPLVVEGKDFFEMFFDGGLAAELDLLVSAISAEAEQSEGGAGRRLEQ